MEILIVDGYNVINFRPGAACQADNLEAARDKLVDILLEYGAYKDFRVIVVFDAHLAKGQGEKLRVTDTLEVVYTRENETADSRIEKLAYILARESRRVYVVTSDQAEQMAVLGAGAFRMSSREFWEDVDQTKRQIRRHISEKEDATKRHELAKHLKNDVYSRLDAMRRDDGKTGGKHLGG